MVASSWLLAIGAVVGLGWTVVQVPARMASRTIDEGLVVLLGCLFGGRVGHVIVHWAYYQAHWIEIPQVWTGGLSSVGALIGAVVFLILLALLTRQSMARLADRLLPMAAVVATAGWLMAWWSGSAYGPLADGKWWGLKVRDESGQLAARLPIQLLEAVFTLAAFWFVDRLRLPEKPGLPGRRGRASAIWLLVMSLQLLALAFIRADPGQFWNGLRVDIWVGLALSILSLGLVLRVFWPQRSG